MTIQLTDDVKTVLDAIGVEWPDIDEDAVRQMSQAFGQCTSQAQQAIGKGQAAAHALIAANKGSAIDAFKDCWNGIADGPFKDLTDSAMKTKSNLDSLAQNVTASKQAILDEIEPFTSGIGKYAADLLGAIEDALPEIEEVIGEIMDSLGHALWAVGAALDDFFRADHYPLSWDEYQKGEQEGKNYKGTEEERQERDEELEDIEDGLSGE